MCIMYEFLEKIVVYNVWYQPKNLMGLGMVLQAFNPSTWQVGGGSVQYYPKLYILGLKPAWDIYNPDQHFPGHQKSYKVGCTHPKQLISEFKANQGYKVRPYHKKNPVKPHMPVYCLATSVVSTNALGALKESHSV